MRASSWTAWTSLSWIRISGIPPAIAIDQTNPVRTSRSTVGTMTELNDHLKLLFARAGSLFCECCGKPVRSDSAESILEDMQRRARAAGDPRLLLCFPVPVLRTFSETEVRELLARQGYTRIFEPAAIGRRAAASAEPVKRQKKGRAEDQAQGAAKRMTRRSPCCRSSRIASGWAVPNAAGCSNPWRPRCAWARGASWCRWWMMRIRRARLDVWRYSAGLHCPDCDRTYSAPTPSRFSFNSPIGACETCRGFGRRIGIDYGLVIPG